MATTADLTTVRKSVVSILQASLINYGASAIGAAPDRTVRQYASNDEITDRALEVDGEICTLICNTLQHPFQTTFIQTSGALVAPSQPLPTRNGMVLKVLTQAGFTTTFIAADVTGVDDIVHIDNHGLFTGQPVQLTTSGTLPTGLSLATTYYIIRVDANNIKFASTAWNAYSGTAIELTGQGNGTNTITSDYIEGTQTDSKDTVTEAYYKPQLFTQSRSGVCSFWFIEGDELYISSPNSKVVYTDYTKTAALQCPQPYEFAVTAGTLGKIYKDGGDMELSQFYLTQYQNYMQGIAAMASALPAISVYKMAA